MSILFPSYTVAQELYVYSLKPEVKEIFSLSIPNEKKKKTIIFPLSGENSGSFEPVKFQKNHYPFLEMPKQYFWSAKLSSATSLDKDSSTVQIVCYVDQVEKYEIYLICSEENVLKQSVNIGYNGFQSPSAFLLNNFLEITGKKRIDPVTIEEIILCIYPSSKNYRFAINELKILQFLGQKKIEVVNPFFNLLTGQKMLEHSLPIESEYYLFDSSFGKVESGNYYIVDTLNRYSYKEIAFCIFDKIFEYYPYYQYSNLSKEKVIARYKDIKSNDSISFSDLTESLRDLIAEIGDPHFFIMKTPLDNEKKRVNTRHRSPVALFEFYNTRFISAVFDSTLHSISPGDEFLYSVCYEENFEENFEKDYTGNTMLSWKDSIQIVSVSKLTKDTIITKFKYSAQAITIPDNFSPKQNEIKLYDNILYQKINTVDDETYLQFINGIHSINATGIIFDLRNCGGGNSFITERILSHFISSPTIIGHQELIGLNGYKETKILKPHKCNVSTPVCILLNVNTVCAAEAFSHLMRSHTDAVLIGNSKTRGAYATTHDLITPGGCTVRINNIVKTTPYPEIDININGISPDIYVTPSDVEELYPYDDKILHTALKYLKYSYNEIN